MSSTAVLFGANAVLKCPEGQSRVTAGPPNQWVGMHGLEVTTPVKDFVPH